MSCVERQSLYGSRVVYNAYIWVYTKCLIGFYFMNTQNKIFKKIVSTLNFHRIYKYDK